MIRRILVPLDHSTLAEGALAHAVEIARRSEAELRLVHVVEPLPTLPGEEYREALGTAHARAREQAGDYLHRTADGVRRGTGLVVDTATLEGPTATTICDDARTASADLIVMGTHGRTGWRRAWIGSVADRVVREAPSPVLLVRATESVTTGTPAVRLDRLLVPLDGSPGAEEILGGGLDRLAVVASSCTLVEVVRPVLMPEYVSALGMPLMCPDEAATAEAVRGARAYLDGIVDRLREVLPMLHVESRVEVSAAPDAVIAAAAAEADVVAMATRSRGALRLVLGSVADAVLRGTHASLLLVRRVPVTSEVKVAAHEDAGHTLVLPG
jgi:nucleotide-binding universal stress UspA family protein